MDWLAVPMFLSFLLIVFMETKKRKVEQEMYDKYNIRTWHYGYFKHRKMMKALSEADKIYYRKENRKYGRVQLYTLLFVVVYCVTVGIIRIQLGYAPK